MAYPVLLTHRLISNGYEYVTHRNKAVRQLTQELAAARQELDAVSFAYHELQQVAQYHDEIKELHEFRQRFHVPSTAIVQIIKWDIGPLRQQVIVNAGSQHGVTEDMIALDRQFLVGRVAKVFPYYSVVTLITDKASSVAVRTEQGATGIFKGSNSTQEGALLYVSHLAKVSLGERVVSSGEGLVFPRGFLIGTIISDEVGMVHHTIAVKLDVDIAQLKHLLLVPLSEFSPVQLVKQQDSAECMSKS